MQLVLPIASPNGRSKLKLQISIGTTHYRGFYKVIRTELKQNKHVPVAANNFIDPSEAHFE